ncbi:MAG: ATP-binding cassette domain-containing protein [Dehalococcoidales bacterium]|jgi:ABC-2 type transport system ATP-binding protein|nr:ATP-binding cassette domain-containing protein [Dehalococcoidales bacterium]
MMNNGQMSAIAVDVKNIYKTYGKKTVVSDVSFSVGKGEVFGLIGPNGAGKTTTIRMMMDIIKPDSGDVYVLGEKFREDTKNKIGYLPEERGLYKKQTVSETLKYMASLKGITVTDERIDEMLEHVGMLPHKNKKIEEMSRGMGQLIQFLVTVIHNPALVILDEPFAGLDPVNTELLKGLILELKEQGKSIIFSTHQMNQVEELCDRLFMINKGTEVLYGKLDDIKHQYRENSVFITYEGNIGSLKGVTESRQRDEYTEFFLDSNTTPQDILQQLIDRRVTVNRFEIGTPSLHEIFIRIAGVNGDGDE